jgi:hypothetical protein
MIDGFLSRNFPGQYITWSTADRLQFVQALYDVCSVEGGSLGDSTDLCSFFTYTELDVFAILDDISNYVERGPTKLGNSISSRVSCLVVRNMISNADTSITDPIADAHAADMRFAHAETLMPVLSQLGWFTEPGVDERNVSAWINPLRKWNSGVVAPMTTNLQFVLYQYVNTYLCIQPSTIHYLVLTLCSVCVILGVQLSLLLMRTPPTTSSTARV